MSDPDVMLRVRVREVIAQWVTGEACDQIIEQALQSAAAVPSELREKRVIGYAVAKAYAGHTDSGSDTGATATYVRATTHEVAAALAALTGEPHPLATQEGW